MQMQMQMLTMQMIQMPTVARIVDGTFYPIVAASCVVWIVQAQCANGIGFVAVIALTLVIKHMVGRTRPDRSTADSFPSAHASTAAYVALAGPFPALIMVAWAALVAWSRVQLGRHHPSDVAAGLALGAVASLLLRNYNSLPAQVSQYTQP